MRRANRSYKANALTEIGTVSETAVKTGAELKGYGGFSGANCLERADTDFDFGSDDFAVVDWFNRNGRRPPSRPSSPI